MKITIIAIAFFSLIGIHGYSQNTKLVLKLQPGQQEGAIHLKNYNKGTDLSILSDGKGKFTSTVNLPGKGFYTLDRIGQIYLEPGRTLEITQKGESGYQFKGRHSRENELLLQLQSLRKTLIPLNLDIEVAPSYALLRQTVPEFAQTVKTYKDSVAKISSQSNNPFFRELAIGDADSFVRVMLVSFSDLHGADSVQYANLLKLMKDPKSRMDPNFELKRMRAMYLPTLKSFLNQEDKAVIKTMYSEGFKHNDSTLLASSDWYGLMLSTLIFADQPVDQKKMKESYLQRFRQIEQKFPDKRFANYLIAQQGIAYMGDAKYTRLGLEPAHQVLKNLDLPVSSQEMIERAYLKMKNDESL